MTWNQWYALRSYLRVSLWIVPFVALLLEQVAFRTIYGLDARIEWIPAWPFGLSGTQTALQTIITMSLSFIVFTFGSLLVAIQVASGQLTPRIIATTLLRDNVIRITVGLFVFTLLFALGTVARIEATVPRLVMWAAAILGIISVMAFLFLIDYAARLLRPVSILWRVSEKGLAVIDYVYPNRIGDADRVSAQRTQLSAPDAIVTHGGISAIVLAVNLEALVAEAPANPSSCSMSVAARSMSARYENRLRLGPNVPSSKTLLSPSASSWILRLRPCLRQSTIRRPRCLPSTSFIGCFEMSAGGICTTNKSWTTKDAFG
jgi:uncharacterized membrane protein